VAFFLGDAAFLADPKFRALSRRLPDADDFNSAVGAYFIALAQSRRNGSPRIDVAEETQSRFVDDLRAVRLIDDEGFPTDPWRAWEAMSPQQAAAGRARAEQAARDGKGRFVPATSDASGTSALETLDQRVQPSPPLPSTPLPVASVLVTGSSQAPTAVPAREAGQPSQNDPRLTREQYDAWASFDDPRWRFFKGAWLGRGFLWPPFGEPSDDDTSQRGLLWQVADARPRELGEWVRLAPGRTTRQVIEFVLERWHGIREEVAGEEERHELRATAEKRRADSAGDVLRRVQAVVAEHEKGAA
jgi:hypothetical protein